MGSSPIRSLKCPICKKEVAVDSPDVPFCSDRCRMIDLGKWASGDYKISSPILDPDLLEEVEHKRQQENPFRDDEEKHRWKN